MSNPTIDAVDIHHGQECHHVSNPFVFTISMKFHVEPLNFVVAAELMGGVHEHKNC
jgi:hypothetical protein